MYSMSTKANKDCIKLHVLSLACNDMRDEKVVRSLEQAWQSFQLSLRLEQNQEGCMVPEQL